MKLKWKIILGALLAAIIAFGALSFMNRPISEEEVNKKIKAHLEEVVAKNKTISGAMLTICSESTGYYQQFAAGKEKFSSKEPLKTDCLYHSASIGKTFAATLVGMLADEGRFGLDDKITAFLSDDILEGLFVVDGIDYRQEVTIRQLLSHTSGVADFFEGPVTKGMTMMEIMRDEPDRLFMPRDLVAFTRENQVAVGKPGEQFNYSDTGYVLLGLLLEAVEEKAYEDILEERIFKPLGMESSYLLFHEENPADFIGVYLDGIDYSDKNVLSLDWSGGGIITTMEELLKFMKALNHHELVSEDTFRQMKDFRNQYDKGIYYGLGMMYFDFSELSPMLASMSDVYGGIGSTGTFMFYDEQNDTYFIANFGALEFMQKSIEELIQIRMIYDRRKIESE